MKEKIPKTIHYCWFGKGKKNKLIDRCIESWKTKCPDYNIVEWNEDNFDVEKFHYTKEAHDAKKWAFVTDFVRLYIIYNEGGIYLDTDVELVKSLDSLLEYDSFFALESDNYIATGLGFGATKENHLVKLMLNDYKDIHFKKEDGTFDYTPCPVRNTQSVEEYFKLMKDKTTKFTFDNNAFLSSEYFCPYNSATGLMKKTINTYGIHWYNASWRSRKINIQRNILRPIKRLMGVEKFNKLKNKIKNLK